MLHEIDRAAGSRSVEDSLPFAELIMSALAYVFIGWFETETFTSKWFVESIVSALVGGAVLWGIFKVWSTAKAIVRSFSEGKNRIHERIFLDSLIAGIKNQGLFDDSKVLTMAGLCILIAALSVAAGSFAGINVYRKLKNDDAAATAKTEELLEQQKTDPPSLELSEQTLDHVVAEKERLAYLAHWQQVSEKIDFWVHLIVVICLFVALCLAITFWVPRRLTTAYITAIHSRYMTRMLAITTKEEARELSVLELKVQDETTLRAFLTKLLELSEKYNFPIDRLFKPYAQPATSPIGTNKS